MKVLVRVPATTANLGPGFDCLGLALSIRNTLAFEDSQDGLRVEWRNCAAAGGIDPAPSDPAHLPSLRHNLVLRAMDAGFEKARVRPPRLKVRITNCIPIGRGLGSSAAAIVGGLVAANAWCGGRLSQDELLALAARLEGHPDNVSAALLGGLTISVMEGDRVITRRLSPPPRWRAVLFIPVQRLSTRLARSVLPRRVPRADAIFNIGRTPLLVQAFAKADAGLLDLAMQDALHQPYRAALIPGMAELFEAARRAGACGAALSGAGPTLLALTENAEQAERVRRAFERGARALGIAGRPCIARLSPHGAEARVVP